MDQQAHELAARHGVSVELMAWLIASDARRHLDTLTTLTSLADRSDQTRDTPGEPPMAQITYDKPDRHGVQRAYVDGKQVEVVIMPPTKTDGRCYVSSADDRVASGFCKRENCERRIAKALA